MRLFALFILFLSACSFKQPLRSGEILIYKVAKGDNLYSIADRFHVSVKNLAKYNSLNTTEKIKEASVLKIPEGKIDNLDRNLDGLERTSLKPVKEFISKLSWPLDGSCRITSGFGYRSKNFHEGIDLATNTGNSIYASHSGRVIFSGKFSAYGNMIAIRNNNLLSIYGHNSKNLVSKGDTVVQGEEIAKVGSTGRASGPHLHFETRIRNPNNTFTAVDPWVFFAAGLGK